MAYRDLDTKKLHDKNYHNRRKNDPEYQKRRRNSWYKTAYGITSEQYDRMVLSQQNLCAICHLPPRGKGPAAVLNVDHCHKTKRVRALLCNPCNQALGLLGEDPERIQSMLYYLEIM